MLSRALGESPQRASAGDGHRTSRSAMFGLFVCAVAAGTCGRGLQPFAGDRLPTGTWGGDNAGLIVNDTVAHAHVGCTYGNFPAPVALDQDGRFNVPGDYLLRAYPIAVGPSLPAQFAGVVEGTRLTLTVAVNDTVQKKLVVLGPVTVTLGATPRLGPCPICQTPQSLRTGPWLTRGNRRRTG